MAQDVDVVISEDDNEGSLVHMTCDEFEKRYPEIAESVQENSYVKPKAKQAKSRGNSKKVSHSFKVRKPVAEDGASRTDSEDSDGMNDSEELVDESSSYRA
jgi:hypothetical protein